MISFLLYPNFLRAFLRVNYPLMVTRSQFMFWFYALACRQVAERGDSTLAYALADEQTSSTTGQSSCRCTGQYRRPVLFTLGEHRPGHAGQLIGQRRVWKFERLSLNATRSPTR